MKALSKSAGSDFGDTPQKCVSHCDEVFKGSLIETAADKRPTIAKDAQQCKTICQRFGMKALGKSSGADFGDTPQKCCSVCDDVFKASLAETAEPVVGKVFLHTNAA